MSTKEIAECVGRGAAVLDDKIPGWESKINTDELYLGSCEACVLGQLFGDYATGTTEFGFEVDDDGGVSHAAVEWATEHGFETDGWGYEPLTVAWRELISERKQEVTV